MKQITEGLGSFSIGGIEIEVAHIVKIAIIIAVAILASMLVRILVNRFISRSSAYLKIDKTRYKFFKNALNALIYVFALIAIIHSIPPLRSISLTLLTGAGIFAAVLGFASQQAFSNIISGIFVVLSRPFRVGDVVRVGRDSGATNDLVGVVEDITLRHTVIRDFQNRRIIIPNSVINMEVIVNNNIADARARRNININISYESDISKAIAIIQEEARKHPYYIDARTKAEIDLQEPDVLVRVIELGEYAVKLRAYVWAPDFDKGWDMHCELNQIIVERFRKEGIEIPYPHHVIINRKEMLS